MSDIRKLVFFERGVETLTYFSHEMAASFRKMGYQIFFFDIQAEYADGRCRTQSDSELSHQAAYDNTTDGPQEYNRPEYFCWQRQTETLSPTGTPLRLIR